MPHLKETEPLFKNSTLKKICNKSADSSTLSLEKSIGTILEVPKNSTDLTPQLRKDIIVHLFTSTSLELSWSSETGNWRPNNLESTLLSDYVMDMPLIVKLFTLSPAVLEMKNFGQ
jgi:hypothetical protein